MDGADKSVERLLNATAGSPDPSKSDHVVELRVWLNSWNCRIPYPRDGVDLLVPSLDVWWKRYRRRLKDVPLTDLDDRQLDAYANAYEELIDMPAGINNVGTVRSLAPTASSKLLWVLRPQTACPWDVAIAKAGGQGSHRDGYANHLRKARAWAQGITREAAARGIDNVPKHVCRPHSTLVRIYDEWSWASTRPTERTS
ncbi:MAG: hypothetical protein JJD93_10725 [Ilumatobacteraceae bacterium]|nr:hypothetical protein [Ilumatobacteraceae bacterium]